MLKKITKWLQHFDIKPQPPVVGSMLERARESIDTGEVQLAIQQLKDILRASPTNKLALQLLSTIYLDYNYYAEGLKLLRFCVRSYPQEAFFWRYRGALLCRTGKRQQGIKALKRALSLNPDDPNSRHLLQSANHDISLNTSIDYVENLFNNYAHDFEQSLTKLKYSGPLELITYLTHELGNKFNNILDLGCGTGLVGQEIAQRLAYSSLVGVDIAEQMLAKAQDKHVYDELHNMEIVEYLTQAVYQDLKYDLIISVDVFMYIGELSNLFKASANALNPSGFFVFTVEDNIHNEDYFLDINGRFSHSQTYIAKTLAANKLKIITKKRQALRYELAKAVNCYMYITTLS